jgi:hypothetical protein
MPVGSGRRRMVRAATLLCLAFVAGAAGSQSLVITRQVLDRVVAFNATTVLEMPFDDANRTQDFFNTGIVGTNFVECKLTAIDGLFCLDGKVLRRWPNTAEPGTFINELSCNDAALGLDGKKTDTCTGMTVSLAGDIFLAGRKGTTFSLIKVIAKPSSGCPSGWSGLSGGRYCAREQYAGRPQLIDIDPIDGDVGAAFKPCPTCAMQSGVLGLEEKKTVVFFPDPKPTNTTSPIVIASGQAWGLNGNEQLLGSALMQIPDGSAFQNFVLVTTTNGRILAKRTDAPGSVFQVFSIPVERQPSSIQCNFDAQNYGIRTSTKSGRIYLTDRNFCQVVALVPNGLPFTTLVNAGDTEDLTLSTADTSGTYPPIGPTLAPGISIDLRDCSVNCTIVEDETGTPAASFLAVKLNTGSNSNATAFLVKGIPDCRYADDPAFPPEMQQTCTNAVGAVVDPDNVGDPAAQLLNVTPLLPAEILKLFDTSGVPPAGLPKLLISRQYRAQKRTDFIFEAFFFVTEPGVHFVDNFTAEFDVPILEGVPASLGCVPDPGNLIAWDVMTNVSELYRSTDINGDNLGDYVDTLTNVGCRNPTKTQQTRISLLPYNLEINPDTYGPTFLSPVKSVTLGNDAVFARLVQNLYDDLEFVRRELACKLADAPSGQPPISASVCNTLASKWANGKIKLDKCINAAFQPKQSTADENCQSFVSQLTNYRSSIPATTPTRDIANRVGELKMRVDVIRHVYDTRMLPSMTTAGFCREQSSNPLTCPDPWQ